MKKINFDLTLRMIILKDGTRIMLTENSKIRNLLQHIEVGSLKIKKSEIREVL